MHRSTVRLTVLAAAATLAACAATPSDSDMAAEAARQFAEMRASIPLETDREKIDYIHCVATAIVDVLPPEYRNLPWDMAIFEADAVNAFAMPGGKIGVMTGILKAADNQDRLAAVLGHEVAHVTQNHAAERASRAKPSQLGVQVAAILLGGGHSGATYTAYEALSAGAAFGIMLPFSRGQETEADVVGLEYMARAGFDPRESVALWQNMEKATGGNAPAEFMSTHPASSTRIDNLVSQFGKTLVLYNEAKANGRNPECE
jgi:predicted Zn-dependent protease